MTDRHDEQREGASGTAVETRPEFEPSDRPPAEPEPVTDPPGAAEDVGQGNDVDGRDCGRPAAEGDGDGVSAETPEAAEGPATDGQDARPVGADAASAEGSDDGAESRLADPGDRGSAATLEAGDLRAAEVEADGADLPGRDEPEPGSPDDAARTLVDQPAPGVLRSNEPGAEAPHDSGDHSDRRELDMLRDQNAALQADNAQIKDRLAALENEVTKLRDRQAGRDSIPGSRAQAGTEGAHPERIRQQNQATAARNQERTRPGEDRRLPLPASAYGFFGGLAGAAGDLTAQLLPHAATGLENAGIAGGLIGAGMVPVVEWRRREGK
jgi:hypothetical protein